MDKDMIRCQADSEQQMAEIMNERTDSLDNFLSDRANEHDINNVKAYISFAMAAHYAIRCLSKED